MVDCSLGERQKMFASDDQVWAMQQQEAREIMIDLVIIIDLICEIALTTFFYFFRTFRRTRWSAS